MILIILGVLLAVGVLGLVHQMTMFGNTCYYIGELNFQTTQCVAPVFYYAALGAAALLVLIGLALMLRLKSPSPSK
jgi:hypothetical protein